MFKSKIIKSTCGPICDYKTYLYDLITHNQPFDSNTLDISSLLSSFSLLLLSFLFRL